LLPDHFAYRDESGMLAVFVRRFTLHVIIWIQRRKIVE
jgi:hypothetical protein